MPNLAPSQPPDGGYRGVFAGSTGGRCAAAKVFVMHHHGICRSASLAHFLLRASHRSAGKARALVLEAKPSAYLGKAYCESAEQFLRRGKR